MTSVLIEGLDNPGMSFEEFVWRCTSQFLVHLRDAPIPKGPVPAAVYPFYVKEVADRRAELARLSAMDPDGLAREAAANSEKAFREWCEYRDKCAARRARCERMQETVAAWVPPTQLHENLKKLMLKQLEEYLRWDCTPYKPPNRSAFQGWASTAVSSAAALLQYAEERLRKEKESVAKTNEWIQKLADSLKIAP